MCAIRPSLYGRRAARMPHARAAARTALAGAVLAALAAWSAAAPAAETLEGLKAEVEALKKRVNEATEWKDVLSHAHLAGYGAVTYTSTRQPGVNDAFTGVRFNPIFHYEFHEKVLLESELELEAKSDGETETKLEYLAVDLFLHDNLMLIAGKFLSPLGQFRQNLHPLWINKLASEPPGFGHEGAAPEAEVGLELRGGWPMGEARGNYAVYLANGPELKAEGGEIEEVMTEGFTRDADNKKVLGARVGILPIPKLELGVSAAAGKTSVTLDGTTPVSGEPTRDYEVLGADASYSVGGFKFLAEYVKTKVGEAAASIAPDGGTWQAWYAQLSYQIPQTKWEGVLRYTDFDSPHTSQDQKQTAVGINYLFAPHAVAKLTYESNDGKVAGTAADADRVLVQLAYGF